jgi:hypothetical protein
MLLVEVLPDGGDLTALELGDLDGSPSLGGADHGAGHRLRDGALGLRRWG